MSLLIRQRVFSWTDSYDVYNDEGEPVYFVKAEFLSLGHQIHVFRSNGEEVGLISQKIFHFMPTFEISVRGQNLGFIKKRFSFHQDYDIDYRGWECRGDFWGWDYDIYAGEVPIAYIHKKYFAWGDTYVIDGRDPRDELPVLMLAIAIDAANCSNRD